MSPKRYPLFPDFSYFDPQGRLKPYAYQELLAQLVDRQLEDPQEGLTMDQILGQGLAWVLTSITVQIKAPLPRSVTLYGSTHYAGRKGPYFRREYQLLDGSGKLLARAASYSVLIDLKKRSIFRKKDLPFDFPPAKPPSDIDIRPSLREKLDYQTLGQRTVTPSTIDGIGHMNNSRYGEWAYDSLPKDLRDRLHHLRQIDIYFTKEVSLDEKVTLLKHQTPGPNTDQTTYIRGLKEDQSPSFDLVYSFGKNE